MRGSILCFALAVSTAAGATPEATGRILQVRLVRARIGPRSDGKPWDVAQVRPRDPSASGSSCCHGIHVDDTVDPDVQVTVSHGPLHFSSRVHFDQAQPTLGEYAYFPAQPDGPFTVEVVDRDSQGAELIGKTSFAPPEGGGAVTLRFGAVEALELEVHTLEAAETAFDVDAVESDLETPLYLMPHQAVRVQASGKTCADRRCGGAEGLRDPELALLTLSQAPLGQLSIISGELDDRRSARYQSDAEYRADSGGYLGLRMNLAPSMPLSGGYHVRVRVNP